MTFPPHERASKLFRRIAVTTVVILIVSIWLVLPYTPLRQPAIFSQVGFTAFLFCFARINIWLKWGLLFGAVQFWIGFFPHALICGDTVDPYNYWLAKLLTVSIVGNLIVVVSLCLARKASWKWWRFSLWQVAATTCGVALAMTYYRSSVLGELNKALEAWNAHSASFVFQALTTGWCLVVVSALGFSVIGIPICIANVKWRFYIVQISIGVAIFLPLLNILANHLAERALNSGLPLFYTLHFFILCLFAIQLYGLNFALRSNGICWLYQIDEQELG